MLLLVAHHKTDGAPRGTAFKHPRKQFHAVAFVAWRRDPALSRTSSVQFALNVVHIHLHSRRHTVYHAAHRRTMALAEGRQSKIMSQCIHLVAVRWFIRRALAVGAEHSQPASVPHTRLSNNVRFITRRAFAPSVRKLSFLYSRRAGHFPPQAQPPSSCPCSWWSCLWPCPPQHS